MSPAGDRPPIRPSAYLALGGGVLILGSSAILVRWAQAPGIVTAFYRMAIGSLLLAIPFFRQSRAEAAPFWRKELLWAVLGGLLFAMDLIFWSTGIMLSGATSPTLMANTAPLWVGLGSFLLLGERRGRRFWLGLALAMVGAAVVLGQDWSQATGLGVGTLLGLLAAIFYGGFHLASQQGRARLGTLTYFWISTTTAALVLLALNALLGQPLVGYSVGTYGAFLASGVIVQVAGWLVINYVQGYLPASVVSPTLLGQPVVTAVLAGLILTERLTLWHAAGGAAVLAGVYLVHRSRRDRPPRRRSRRTRGAACRPGP